MSQRVVVLGSGGHAKVVIELLRGMQCYQVIGCVAPASPASETVLGVPRMGDDEALAEIRATGVNLAFVAIGDNQLRSRLSLLATAQGFQLVNAISRQAAVSPAAQLAQGVAIMAGANVGPDCVVGQGVIINSNASVDHDVHLADYVHIGPGATLAGCVSVGEFAFVATGSSVIPGQRIGARSVVGAGAVVVRSIPDDVIAYGSPARPQRTNRAHAPLSAETPPSYAATASTLSLPTQRRAG